MGGLSVFDFVLFARNSLRSVRTFQTLGRYSPESIFPLGRYSPIRPSRLVNKMYMKYVQDE